MAKKSRMAKATLGKALQAARANGQEPGGSSQETAGSDGESFALLTDREKEVLKLYLRLLNAKEVARELGTRPQTIRNQLASIERKLGVEGREELARLGVNVAL